MNIVNDRIEITHTHTKKTRIEKNIILLTPDTNSKRNSHKHRLCSNNKKKRQIPIENLTWNNRNESAQKQPTNIIHRYINYLLIAINNDSKISAERVSSTTLQPTNTLTDCLNRHKMQCNLTDPIIPINLTTRPLFLLFHVYIYSTQIYFTKEPKI